MLAADVETEVYGAADLAFALAYAGFVNSETPVVLGETLNLVHAPGTNVGSYLITRVN